jgi:hypothetical protein
MPVLAFFAVVGSVLFALLFVADATLENSSPAIVTSQRTGLPAPRYHNAIKTLTTASAPAPDMTSQAVLAAQPKSASDALAKIEAGARETRAEAPPLEKVWGEVSAKRPKHYPKIVPSRSPSTTNKTNSTDFPLRAISASLPLGTRTRRCPLWVISGHYRHCAILPQAARSNRHKGLHRHGR